MSNSLKGLGVHIKEYDDGVRIEGLNQAFNTSNAGMPFKATSIDSYGDHRIAMASAIACTRAKSESIIKNTKNVVTSFPNFLDVCKEVGININKN